VYVRCAMSGPQLSGCGPHGGVILAVWTALTKDRRPGSLSSPTQVKSGSLRHTEVMATQRLSTSNLKYVRGTTSYMFTLMSSEPPRLLRRAVLWVRLRRTCADRRHARRRDRPPRRRPRTAAHRVTAWVFYVIFTTLRYDDPNCDTDEIRIMFGCACSIEK
jgi:hypothetical protein